MLELQHVSKQVGASEHISDVSLKLQSGSVNVLLGPTLSGKTSLMRLMAGLDRPTSGDVYSKGKQVTGVSVRNRDVAMVYQQFINYPAMTVFENIASPLRLQGADAATINSEVHKAAELLKLTEFLDRTPLNLSGGQQQRTALARALVKGAELVLLDEPLANLDYKLREELRVELPRLFAETGAVFVYATTEPHEALLLGGYTATLHEGRVTQFGPTIDVYNQPVNLSTAQTFSDPPLNTFDVHCTADKLIAEGADAGVPINLGAPVDAHSVPEGKYTLAFRSHHASLSATGNYQIAVHGTISTSEITGSETYIHMNIEQSHWVVLTHGVHKVHAGDAITVYLDPARYYLFSASDGSLVQSPARLTKAA
ncbi:MAG: ABC transporter ATP-binding protein [Granulosicoccus sp.]